MKKNVCFVDTGCWIALLNKNDKLHQVAEKQYKQLLKNGIHFVTTSSVVNEFANSLCQTRFRSMVIEFYKRLQHSSRVDIIFADEQLWKAGWDLYEARLDKDWGLTDCISIVIMQEYGLTEALAYDKHFVQAGFRAILREAHSQENKEQRT